jgi:hypothetical protein
MDVDAIRCQFIQDNLRLAVEERDRERRREILQAFRAYFEWFGGQLPEQDRLGIKSQLATLESLEASKLPNVR